MKEGVLLDLFSGTGGFPLGLQQAGFTFSKHYYSEIDPYAIANYTYNFKGAIYAGAVEKIKKGQIERPDIITFGFPCQDVSVAGKRRGLKGNRSGLFYQAVRLIRELEPRVFIFENVKGLLFSNEGKDFETVIKEIANLGLYHCQWQLLNTAWFLPQNRERVYFAGTLGEEPAPKIFPFTQSDSLFKTGHETKGEKRCGIVSTITAGYSKGVSAKGETYVLKTGKPYIMALRRMSKKEEGHRLNLRTDGKSNTITSVDKDNYLSDNKGIRRLTPLECERLQGFPDHWTKYGNFDGVIKEISDTRRYIMMGNAVSVPVVRAVAARLNPPKKTEPKTLQGTGGPQPPAYFRARINYLHEAIRAMPENRQEKNNTRKLLRYGVIDESIKETAENAIRETINQYSNDPLTFTELTRYNTWFTRHPEKVCGKELVTTSHQFPLTIKGTNEDIIRTIRKTISPKGQPMKKLQLKARALKLKLQLQKNKDWYTHFNGLGGVDAVTSLGSLGELVSNEIRRNTGVIEKILKEDEKYSPYDTLSFDQVVKRYNPGISEEEIKAWVWYKRGQGEKMRGWDSYYLKLEQDIQTQVTAKPPSQLSSGHVTIKDNHFRDLLTVEGGTLLGKLTSKKLEYDNETYRIIKTDDSGQNNLPENALVYVREKDIDILTYDAHIKHKTLRVYVEKGLLFYNNGQLQPYPVYGYGNMYDRELQLQKDKSFIIQTYGQEAYERQYNLVMNPVDKGGLRPRLLSVMNPDPTQRPKILAISQFAQTFTISSLKDEAAVDFKQEETSLTEAFRTWLNGLDKSAFKNLTAYEIIKYYLDGDNLTKKLNDDEKSNIEKYGMLEGEELFTKFLYEAITFEDQQKIDFSWNRQFNGHSAIPYHRVPIGFTCSAMFKSGVLRFSQAQREAISFMEIARSGIIAYDVGVGKTMSAIITLANNLYAGKCLRPLIVVPNPTYQKWVREIIGFTDPKTKTFLPGVLSNVGYKVNEWYNLGVEVVKKLKLEQAIEEKSITVITYEGFAKIGYGADAFRELFMELAYILNQEDVSNLSPREKEKRYQQYKEMLGRGNKGTIADIETLGIDYIVVDEAHNYKNVFQNVMAEKGVRRFKISGSQSMRAVKCFFLCNYVQRMHGRNVMLLTATPFTNSPLEIYSMLSLVAYHYMRKNGLANVQRFMENFVLQTLEYVNSYDDTIKEQHVVKSFNNRLVLQQLIFNHIAYKTGEDAGVKRPCKINLPRLHEKTANGALKRLARESQLLTYLEMTPLQKDNQREIVELARSARPGDGDLMRALAQSLDNAVSPFLYRHSGEPEDYREFVDESPKIKYVVECIRSVKEWHEKRKEPVSGQVIYINRGKDYFRYIKEYLEKEVGYHSRVKFNNSTLDEVEVITSGISLERKEDIKEAFLAGVCKIIIGTSSIREGIDLQANGTVLYNCYPDWNPTDVKQLEGRIWRQGNKYGYVRVVMPLVQDSMDVFVFQKLEEKTSRLNDLWYRGGSANVIDLDSMDPEEVKFALFTNIDAILNIVLDKERKEIRRRISLIEGNIDTMSRFSFKLRMYFQYQVKCRERLQSMTKNFTAFFFSEPPRHLTMDFWQHKNEASRKLFMEKVQKVIDDANQYTSAAVQEDKELLRLARIFYQVANEMGTKDSSNDFSDFKMYLSEVRKAEETILKQKGYTIHDDMEMMKEGLTKDKERALQELETLQSEQYYQQKYQEVKEKKEKLNVSGGSPETRAAEFAGLNYLLSYLSSDVDSDSCMLPGREKFKLPPAHTNEENKEKENRNEERRDKERERLKLKVRALILKLKLMKN